MARAATARTLLIWGGQKAGKSTFIQEAVKAETRRGRQVLHVHAKEADTLEQLLALLFRRSKTTHFARQWLRIPTKSTKMPEIEHCTVTSVNRNDDAEDHCRKECSQQQVLPIRDRREHRRCKT
eukprot:1281664-Rhodomonas_salina.3